MRGTSLEIRLLGRLEVTSAGRTLELPRSRKARALLAYLAATGHSHSREHLCDLLWEGPADPRGALRGALSRLRPLLAAAPDARIIAEGDRVGLEADGAIVDLAVVRAVAEAAADHDTATLKSAAARFRGAFIDGLNLPSCYRFDAWCTAQREAARRLHISLLRVLIERLDDDPEQALEYARARLVLEPAAEAASIDVIRILSKLGRARDAIAQYETCRRILREEVGTRPSPALDAARRAIPASTSHSPQASAAMARKSLRPAEPPLVGRVRERDILAAMVEGTAESPRGLLLVGEPGIGKTRLLEELGTLAEKAGGTVLSGRAFEAELVRPYGPWIDALRGIPIDAIPPALRPALGHLLTDLGPPPPESADRAGLFDAVARLIEHQAAAAPPLALLMDDVQWLDDASAALLHFIARRRSAPRVILGLASRSAELHDNPVVARLLLALRREGLLRQLDVAPLDPTATADLVRQVDPAADPERLSRESEGNPLFALELARRQGKREALAGTLGDLIDERLGRLEPDARRLVEWAAALGRDFDLETLRLVSGIGAAELLHAADELERRRILRPVANGYDFSHDLLRRGAYRSTSLPRRELLHSQIARALFARGDADHHLAGEVAHHAALGGDPGLAARACLAAARHALWTFAPEDAAKLIGRATAFLEQLPVDVRLEIRIELLGLSVYPGMKQYRRADPEEGLSAAIREAKTAGLQTLVHRGFQLIADIHYLDGDFAGAVDRSLRAQHEARAADPATVVRAIADTARCLGILERDMRRAEKLAHKAATLADVIGYDGHELAQALGYVHHHRGRLDEAVACFERATALARAERKRWFECASLARLAMIELERRSPHAVARADDLLAVTRQLAEGSHEPFAEALAGIAAHQAGTAGALDRIDEALCQLRNADSRWMVAYVQNLTATLLLETGEVDAATSRAEEALRAATVVSRHGEIAIARALLACIFFARGDAERSARLLEDAARDLATPGLLSARARRALAAAGRSRGSAAASAPPHPGH